MKERIIEILRMWVVSGAIPKIADEIIATFKSELEKQPKDTKADLYFFRTNILRHLNKEEMLILRDWLNSYDTHKKEPEGVTAEEILKPYADLAHNIAINDYNNKIYVVELSDAVKAMKAYAHAKQPGLREELIKFFAWQNTLDINETKRVVDNYLKYRINEMDKT